MNPSDDPNASGADRPDPIPPAPIQGSSTTPLNPWRSIWLHPRKTIRQIVDTDPRRGVLWLAMAATTAQMLTQGLAAAVERGIPAWMAFAIAVVVGIIFGVIGLYLFGWIYRSVGNWFGGQAHDSAQVRAAIAWTEIPVFAALGLWVVYFVLSKINPLLGMTMLAAYVPASFAFGIWAFVIRCHAVGEVHRFSAWKACVSMVLGNFLFALVITVVTIIPAIAIPNFVRARAHDRQDRAPSFAASNPVRNILGQTKTSTTPAPYVRRYEEFQNSGAPVQVTLSDGKVIEARIVDEKGPYVYLDTAKGTININKSEITDIRKKEPAAGK